MIHYLARFSCLTLSFIPYNYRILCCYQLTVTNSSSWYNTSSLSEFSAYECPLCDAGQYLFLKMRKLLGQWSYYCQELEYVQEV